MKSITKLVTVFVILLAGCKTDNNTADFSSPKSLFVDQIASHTAGVISITNSIKLKLAKSYGDSLSGKNGRKTDF